MAFELRLRTANRDDQHGIISLIDSVFREYDAQVCLEGAEQDLLDIQTNYIGKGGEFWVLERIATGAQPEIVGTHSAIPLSGTGKCTFKRLYSAAELRGTKWTHQLMQVAIDWSREQGFNQVQFWSDTRFQRAHQFFAKFGFRKTGDIRQMDDSTEPYSEFFFVLDLE